MIHRPARRAKLVILVSLLITFIVSVGCGRYGPPQRRQPLPPDMDTNIDMDSATEGVGTDSTDEDDERTDTQ